MKAPYKRTMSVLAAALGTNVDGVTILGKVPFDGTISAVGFIANAAITGANTNTRKVAIENRGQAGAGSAIAAALQFDSGVNAVAFDEKDVPVITTADANVVVAGDILVVNSTSPGTGQADPGGLYVVTITRS